MGDRFPLALVARTVVVLYVLFHQFAPAAGAELVPKKASDLHTLTALTTDQACPGNYGVVVQRLQNPDGSQDVFSLPAGTVLIITSWAWETIGVNPGQLATAQLLVPNVGGPGFANVSLGRANANTLGQVAGSVELSPGVPVKGPLCFESGGPSGQVIVHGFVAKDK